LATTREVDGPLPGRYPARDIMTWQFYIAAIPAVILVGLSKGGFSGLSLL